MGHPEDVAGAPAAGVKRIGAVIEILEETADEYVRLHQAVWPEVLETLRRAHITNYSIFRRGNLLFSYMEYRGQDQAADMAKVAEDPVTQRWWALCMPLQRTLRASPEEDWWVPLDEVFHLA